VARLVELAAQRFELAAQPPHPSRAQPLAHFGLRLLPQREARFDRALALGGEQQDLDPRVVRRAGDPQVTGALERREVAGQRGAIGRELVGELAQRCAGLAEPGDADQQRSTRARPSRPRPRRWRRCAKRPARRSSR
jgi:hypothetical protein